MKVESHILDQHGHCSRCRLQLGGTQFLTEPPRELIVGDRIGLITDAILPPGAHLITRTDLDSNSLCVARGESIP